MERGEAMWLELGRALMMRSGWVGSAMSETHGGEGEGSMLAGAVEEMGKAMVFF